MELKRCPKCGRMVEVYGSSIEYGDYGRCGYCERKEIERLAKKSGRSSRPSEPVPLWATITAGVLIFGIAFFFFSQTALYSGIVKSITGSENAAINQIRRASFITIKDKGEELNADAIVANKTALDAYIASDESYRMKGTFEFGRNEGTSTLLFETKVEMSYNAALDVYKFTINNKEGKGYQPLKDAKLAPFHIADGTYYIVKEGNKTCVLSDCGGEKKIEDVTGGKGSYVFLTMYMMNGNINTNFMSEKQTANTSYNYQVWDGDYYFRSWADTKYNLYPRWIELKTHKNKPVKADYRANIPNSNVGYKFVVDYYYSGISKDAPDIANWK